MLRVVDDVTGVESALLRALVSEFGAGDPRLVPIDVHPVRSIYRVDHHGGAWVARIYPPERPRDRVDGDAHVLRAIRQLAVEQLVETVDGRGSIHIGARGVVVTQFVEGCVARAQHAVLRRVGATLGALHALGTDLDRRAGSLPREDLDLAQWCLQDVADDMPGVLRAPFEQLQQAVATTDDCESLPAGLVHSDCHLGNVIECTDGPVLIDWAGAGRGPFVASLGWLLYTAAVQTPGGVTRAIEAELADAVLDGYLARRHLTAAEVAGLPDAVRFRPLVIACRQLRESVRARQPERATGWWSRYAEADLVAGRAARLLA
jgi:Ser/Thr protein kinase RdoA (MazF antagonist)